MSSMDRKNLRKEISKDGQVGQSKVLRTKHIDTLNVLSTYVDQNRALEDENRALNKQLLELSKELNTKSSMPASYIEDIEKEIKSLRKENEKFEQKLETSEGKNKALAEANERLAREAKQRQRELSDFKKQNSQGTASYMQEMETMMKHVDTLKSRNTELEGELEKEKDTSHRLQLHNTSAAERTLELERQVEALQGRVEEAERRYTALAATTKKPRKGSGKKRETANKGKDQAHVLLTGQLNDALANVEQQATLIDKLKRRNEGQAKELARLKQQSKSVGSDSAERNVLLAQLDAKVLALEAEKQALAETVNTERERVAQLLAELDALRRQLHQAMQQQGGGGGSDKRGMFQEYVKLKRENEQMTQIIDKLRRKLPGGGSIKTRPPGQQRRGTKQHLPHV